jgi:hypothetical protein
MIIVPFSELFDISAVPTASINEDLESKRQLVWTIAAQDRNQNREVGAPSGNGRHQGNADHTFGISGDQRDRIIDVSGRGTSRGDARCRGGELCDEKWPAR